MKFHHLFRITVFFLGLIPFWLGAQTSLVGTVYYTQMDKVEFEPTGRPEFDQYARTMPTEYQFEKMLQFEGSRALYQASPNPSGEPLTGRERWFYIMSKYGRKPQATLKKLYCDFESGSKTELLEFMTREFRVESEIEQPAWKMLNDFKMIMGYTCMGAQKTEGDDEIIAYFAPEIPVPAGPDAHQGLPGLILAVEKNGYTTYLASRIDLEPLEESLEKPKDGKKVTREELDTIMEEKIEEFKKERMGSGRGFHGRR